jgi:integrase
MAKTQGQLEERTPGHWRIRVFIGRDTDGKRRYLSRTVEGTKKEAEDELRELIGKKRKGRLTKPARRSLAAWMDEWLEQAVKPRVRARTLRFYQEETDLYVKPELGPVRLDRLTTLDVQRWTNGLTARGLSSRTVRAAFGTLHAALRQAVRWRLLPADPSEFVELPRRSRSRQINVLDPDQAAAFLGAAQGERYEAFFTLALVTGCRPGELAALRWEDVDITRGTVAVHRAMSRLRGGKVEYTEPKTDRGRRVVTLPPEAVAVLQAHRRRQLKARLASGGTWEDASLVFTNERGAPLDLGNIRNRDLRRIARRARMPVDHFKRCDVCTAERWMAGRGLCEAGEALRKAAEDLTLYSLRHTSATLLLAGGVHAKAVSERMGHASTAFTMDTYVHSLPTAQELAASTLGEQLFKREAK